MEHMAQQPCRSPQMRHTLLSAVHPEQALAALAGEANFSNLLALLLQRCDENMHSLCRSWTTSLLHAKTVGGFSTHQLAVTLLLICGFVRCALGETTSLHSIMA